MTKTAILGGGSWGTALAIVLSRSHRPHDISLWIHDPSLATSAATTRENEPYLPGCRLPDGVKITSELALAVADAGIVVGAIPSAHGRAIYTRALAAISKSDCIFVSATKGLEPSSHLRMTEVVFEICSKRNQKAPAVAVLSGPSFALEVARGDPTAVVVASQCESKTDGIQLNPCDFVQAEFAGPSFRIYTNNDVLGVELAGAMKNVIAIAAGACHGLGLGHNATAALITRGLAEMSRLASALGARAETLSGLAGLGDLVLTCTGALSRNRKLGIELGRGGSLPEFLAGTRMIPEGVGTAAALLALASEHGLELPITEQVNAILHHGKSPRAAITDIMERPQKHE